MKTVRFAQVVDKSGTPEIHLRFGPAEKDPELQRALKQRRVMTVHRAPRGQKKPYGTVGLHADEHSQILVFPKSLASFDQRHVIAINYDLIAEEKLSVRPDAPGEGWKPRKKSKPAVRKSETEKEKKPAGDKMKTPKATKPDLEAVLREVRSAVRELKAGKAVAAHERLEKLL